VFCADELAETKILKQRVRDHLDPKRDLGHSDTPANSSSKQPNSVENAVAIEIPTRQQATTMLNPDGTTCEDCA
jgi:hypothetical protein